MIYFDQDISPMDLTLEIGRQLNTSLLSVDSEYDTFDLEFELEVHTCEYSNQLLTLNCVLSHLLYYLKKLDQQKWIVKLLSKTFTSLDILHTLFVIADKSCNDSNFSWKLDENMIILERELLKVLEYKVLLIRWGTSATISI
jgi:hypothetical protein